MNTYFLMLQGGQESSLDIEAQDMGHAIRITIEKILQGWPICKIRNQSGCEYPVPGLAYLHEIRNQSGYEYLIAE